MEEGVMSLSPFLLADCFLLSFFLSLLHSTHPTTTEVMSLVAGPSYSFMEVLLTLLFNALLLVFVVKLLFALFHMKLAVILLYIAVLLFAMALTGRFPG
ncbi:hypothetical protein GQ55_3G488900 [Panicum hallii var. hallii]|jgi:hypothetical protein|uniref:Uncharacterized protein n=1 Tax=Panicum hallii var. hallii TaxID=1504633 RepID=A0A2T7EJV6_9POAL|nr:hypothetical protein GQ55_3G488900 [Panicum hallii var. hallii]